MMRSSPSVLSEAEQVRALERYQIRAPFLEDGVPLARVARDRGLVLRTARRWVDRYRREGLAGLARKGRSDRGKRHLSDTLRQAIEGLALKKPPPAPRRPSIARPSPSPSGSGSLRRATASSMP